MWRAFIFIALAASFVRGDVDPSGPYAHPYGIKAKKVTVRVAS